MATPLVSHDVRYRYAASPAQAQLAGVNTSLLALGRLIFGGFFLLSGIEHFVNLTQLSAAAALSGVPVPELAVGGTGALLVLGSLSLLTGVRPRIGAAFIALFLLGVTPVMHAFWKEPPGPDRLNQFANFAKNLALLGGACFVGALPQPWPRTIGRTVAPHGDT